MYWRLGLAILLCGSPAAAVELRAVTVKSGTDGLVGVPLTITNAGTSALACTAELAHWYSATVAPVPPGVAARVDLWFEPRTGTYILLNGKRDNMPVAALWCGIEGRAYETRAVIALEPEARATACAPVAGRMVCT